MHWRIDILKLLGIHHDAKVLPIERPPGMELVCPRRPFRDADGLWEIPVTALPRLTLVHLPLASGHGLRWLLRRLKQCWVRRFKRVRPPVEPRAYYSELTASPRPLV